MTIRFRKKSQAEWLVLFILAMSISASALQELFRLPSAIKYTIDLAWLWLLLMIMTNRLQLPNRQLRKLAMVVGTFFLFALVGFFLNYQSVLYFLWGTRNNVRFFVYFFACILFIRECSVDHYLEFFVFLFWLNVPIVLFQYFVLGKTGDFLGGIFGIQKGCNSYMNIFLLVVVLWSILRYLHKAENLGICITKCLVALGISVLSELKVFFVEFLVILLMAMYITRFSYRKILIALGSCILLFLALEIFYLFSAAFGDWFSVTGIWEIIANKNGYTNRNDLNRLTAIPIILERFLTNGVQKVFGLGLGNCETSSFNFLNTPFYKTYGYLHYQWFSSAFVILETGILGLTLYMLFFVSVYYCVKTMEKRGSGNPIYCQMAKIMAVMSLIMIFYNSALRTEAGYMMYFILALPFIRREGPHKNTLPNTQLTANG